MAPLARAAEEPTEALVACNVRAFAAQRFPVWRCSGCGSIHSAQALDGPALAAYYAQYPYHRQRYDLMTLLLYDVYERRLRRAGVQPGDAILDYGCGSGHLLRFLRWKKFQDLAGYDAHSADFADPAPLARRYDCVIAQDVIEHVEDPRALLAQLVGLLKPGGRLVIGTPNADGIDLRRPEDFRHPLHQPYHRHLLSRAALEREAQQLGLSLVRCYLRPYTNTLWPGLNQAFMSYYARCFDDTMDLAFDGLRFHPRLLSPWALLLFFFGYFQRSEADMMLIFTAPPAARALPPQAVAA